MNEEQNLVDANLEGGTYEIIKDRLKKFSSELIQKISSLNQDRKKIFGSIETILLSTERIKTENNCLPRDMVMVGEKLIFGYNVFIGLRKETKLEDVFSIYKFQNNAFSEDNLDLIKNEQFINDFLDLYKYYKNTQFLKFSINKKNLLMIFQIGEKITDIKAFKWQIQDSSLKYIDNRGDRDYVFPPQYDFEWKRCSRDQHIYGKHPHINIEDMIFVECVGGDLTIKIENNTETGEGVYSEPVDNLDQTLDDAEIFYSIADHLILLKIRPYMESKFRYILFNKKTETATRINSIAQACIRLPESDGVIFPNGYYLANGEYKLFPEKIENMKYVSRTDSINGEDFLYCFYNESSGEYVLLLYNLIEKNVFKPFICNGYSLYEDGRLLLFRADNEPKKFHPLQIWQTPFVDEKFEKSYQTDSYLYKVGNKDIVQGISDFTEIVKYIGTEDIYLGLYHDIVQKTSKTIDSYYWIDKKEAYNFRPILLDIKKAAESAISEYEKYLSIKNNTEKEIKEFSIDADKFFKEIKTEPVKDISDYVKILTNIRNKRGKAITLKNLQYADVQKISKIEEKFVELNSEMSSQCVDFLLSPNAFDHYNEKINDLGEVLEQKETAQEIKQLREKAIEIGEALDILTDTVNNLSIEDPNKTTAIVTKITGIYSANNQIKAKIANRINALSEKENIAEFGAQYLLLEQTISNFIGMCETPAKCEELQSKIMMQIEELEGKFSDADELVEKLSLKREEAYDAFNVKKQALIEERNKKASNLFNSAIRILKGVENKVKTLKTVEEINGYFASDAMILKVKDLTEDLRQLDDNVKADEIAGKLKVTQEDALRKLKDRQELFVEGENIIKFGDFKFSVTTQKMELTTLTKNNVLHFHLTGSDYYEPVQESKIMDFQNFWEQEYVSENKDVYRSEFLAFKLLSKAITEKNPSLNELIQFSKIDKGQELLQYIQKKSVEFYDEGYQKGVHDSDCYKILMPILQIYNDVGLLRFHPYIRSHAIIFWHNYQNEELKSLYLNKANSIGKMEDTFNIKIPGSCYIEELKEAIFSFYKMNSIEFSEFNSQKAAHYLFLELKQLPMTKHFIISEAAHESYKKFIGFLNTKNRLKEFYADINNLNNNFSGLYQIVCDWVDTFLNTQEGKNYIHKHEIVSLFFRNKWNESNIYRVNTLICVEELFGKHTLIENGTLSFTLDDFLLKMENYVNHVVPSYQSFRKLKKELTEQYKNELRLDEFEPRVLSSFVRNKLINEVYLPIIGANFAKQIGVIGTEKRTDLMGVLLLISPPGYGKTTLMEYISNRLGLTFIKINGPAIGHSVTSLDPNEARHATAKEEVKKLNLALEMGNNVMIYLDDIQHLNPEFLEKFISLCDAQRKIEGVYKGRPKTYDLRGKKVAVVMAGNPYTESGEKFKIPDMLANRADTYNLGDVIGGKEDLFELSYLENSVTSNPVLNRLVNRSRDDFLKMINIVKTANNENVSYDNNYSAVELAEYLSIIKKLLRIQEIILKVNKQYIYSASQNDAYRTEPPFKLQGSYRNMNKMVEKVLPVMNDEELELLITDHYFNEAQTLTTGTEANFLKFKEISGKLTGLDQERWNEIKKKFSKNQAFKGVEEGDQLGRIMVLLDSFNEHVGDIKNEIAKGITFKSEETKDKKQEDSESFNKLISAFDSFTSQVENIKNVLATGITISGKKQNK